MLTEFIVGNKYTNDQIRFALSVENLGGIRPSIDANRNLRHLVILTTLQGYEKNISDNPYHDIIENNVLIYTAQGRAGDQSIVGRNKRITEQYVDPIPFYCFANEGKQSYKFLGLLRLLRHYQEYQIDSKRDLRRVWLFEFYIHDEIHVVPIETAKKLTTDLFFKLKESKTIDEQEIISLELPSTFTERASVYEAEELRARLMQINPYHFEVLVRDVVEAQGFEKVTVTQASQDGGIDVNAFVPDTNFFFSKTHIQFQVKRWRHSIGSVEINNFRGALNSTAKGVFITTSHFTRAALREAEHPSKPCVSLIDGLLFSKLVKESSIDLSKYKSD